MPYTFLFKPSRTPCYLRFDKMRVLNLYIQLHIIPVFNLFILEESEMVCRVALLVWLYLRKNKGERAGSSSLLQLYTIPFIGLNAVEQFGSDMHVSLFVCNLRAHTWYILSLVV